MLFFKLSNVDIFFSKKTLIWWAYTTNKTLFSIKYVQIINLKKFIIVALDTESKLFDAYISIQEQEEITMNLVRKT